MQQWIVDMILDRCWRHYKWFDSLFCPELVKICILDFETFFGPNYSWLCMCTFIWYILHSFDIIVIAQGFLNRSIKKSVDSHRRVLNMAHFQLFVWFIQTLLLKGDANDCKIFPRPPRINLNKYMAGLLAYQEVKSGNKTRNLTLISKTHYESS